MHYNRNFVWVHKRTGAKRLTPPVQDKAGQDYIRFDSEFESKVYEVLHSLCSTVPYCLVRQLKLPLSSQTRFIHPVRGMCWRVDFALYHEMHSEEYVREFPHKCAAFIEAKGQVSRDFYLTLALLPPEFAENLFIACCDKKGIDAIRRHLDGNPQDFVVHRLDLREALVRAVLQE